MHMSALGLPGYHLHAAYAGDWQLSPTEVRAPHTCVTSLKAHLGPRRRRKCVCVMGKTEQATYLLPVSSEWERAEKHFYHEPVCLCGSTRGR